MLSKVINIDDRKRAIVVNQSFSGNVQFIDVTDSIPDIPNAPILNPLTVISDSEIDASWNAQEADFYTIEYDTVNTFDSPNFDSDTSLTNSYSITGLNSNTEYFVRVSATNVSGTSPYSNIESATTEALPLTLTVQSDNTGTSNNDQFTFPQRSGTSPIYVIRQQGATGNEVTVTSDTDPTTITFIGGAGTYTVEIEGTDIQPFFNNTGDKSKLIDITNYGSAIVDLSSFQGCNNLSIISSITPPLIGTSLNSCYQGTSNLTGGASFPLFDTSQVTSMANMFRSSDFDEDVSSWDVTNVTTFRNMFRQNNIFNSPIFTVTNTTTGNGLEEMFLSATSFNQDLSGWDVSNCTTFALMFSNATSFNQSLGSWNLSSANSLSNMLSNCGMSTENYNKTLDGWVNGGWTIPNGLTLGASSLVVDSGGGGIPDGIAARTTLINTYGWTIIDATP